MSDLNKNSTRRDLRICVIMLTAGILTSAGCARDLPKIYGVPATSPAAGVPWTPPPEIVSKPVPAAAPAQLPKDILKDDQLLSLLDIVEIALRNNPQTAAAWAQAWSAAAAYGSEQGQYYPQVGATAGWGRIHGQEVAGTILVNYDERNYSAAAQLDWLVFDFGGREAAVKEAREALIAADWSHNTTIQNVILQVKQAYYGYVTAKALLEAQEATYKEAERNLDAAKERHRVGVATIADVLQAQTALAQAKLSLDSLGGQIQTTRGTLATAMGLPADTPYDIEIPKREVPLNKTLEKVDAYLAQAEKQRPDLAAARAQARKAEAHVRTVEAQRYPSINATANWGPTYYGELGSTEYSYTAGVQVSVPIFMGFSQHYNVIQAQADEKAARALLDSTKQQVVLEVWTSYYNLKTAEQRVRTSEDLLKSATESCQVALGRYKEGVGTILDLLSAQSALQSARAQRVQATSDWFVSFAQLAHDTGTLTAAGTGSPDNSPTKLEKGGMP
jgi:outer membrane protein